MSAIEVNKVTKVYRLYSSPRDRLREALSLAGRKFHQDFFALNEVSFAVQRGQTVGIIGQNGSGKSTLLQIICGVLQPTRGSVRVNGRIAALLELGAGFNPEFTGRDNVYMNGALMGFSREEMDRRLPQIEAFAEIGEFIDQPVKTYSTGMSVRLAFAAAVNIDPDILVVDEALSVGDMFFQHRCMSRMESFQAEGKTILLATHDVNLAKVLCSTLILLDGGMILAEGDGEYVTEQYMMLIRQRQTQCASSRLQVARKTPSRLSEAKFQFGAEAGRILDVRVLNKDGREMTIFPSGEPLLLSILAEADPSVRRPNIAFILRDSRGYNIYGTDTAKLRVPLKPDDNNRLTVFFSFAPVLAAGSYSFTVRLEDFRTPRVNMLLDKQVGVAAFEVIENSTPFAGVVDLRARAFQDPDEMAARSFPTRSDPGGS